MIKLTLTDEQANNLAVACEFYARMRYGQFGELVDKCLKLRIPAEGYCERHDKAEDLLLDVRKQIYPDLLRDKGHSYGYGKFKDADMAFDVYQVIRYTFDDDRPPFSYYDLPKCEKE